MHKDLVAPIMKELFTEQIVLALVDKLPEKGHRIFMDSWYSSIELGNELTKRGFSFITTLKVNEKGLCDKTKIENNSKKNIIIIILFLNIMIKRRYISIQMRNYQPKNVENYIIWKTEE